MRKISILSLVHPNPRSPKILYAHPARPVMTCRFQFLPSCFRAGSLGQGLIGILSTRSLTSTYPACRIHAARLLAVSIGLGGTTRWLPSNKYLLYCALGQSSGIVPSSQY